MEKTMPQKPAGPPANQVYETPHYRVLVWKMTAGPTDEAAELQVKYVIQHKKHGVILGKTSSYAEAVVAALIEEGRHINAEAAAAEAEARGFALPDEPPSSGLN